MELAAHLPLMEFGEEGQSLARLQGAADAARENGFAAVSANDHFLFATPWLDCFAALAAVADRTGEMAVATTIALPVLRGPVATGEGARRARRPDRRPCRRWARAGIVEGRLRRRRHPLRGALEALRRGGTQLRELLGPESPLAPLPRQPGGIPLWIGSWGSTAGLRRVARLADGWLASAYNTTPDRFAAARAKLPEGFPSALATMWTWITEAAPTRTGC